MDNNNIISVPCLEVNQPIGKFYVGKMNPSDLSIISYSDVRKLQRKEKNVARYMGIERKLQPKRVKEISKYVNLIDATFPNTIILSIESKNASFSKRNNLLKIKRKKDVAQVLDGQHRIAGLENFQKEQGGFEVIVVFFIDMELEDQALVFATINVTQTKVNKSLVIDLFDFAKYRSPQKTCHNIARALNEKNDSPFYKKIKILGTAEDIEKETITQSTFVEGIIKYITSDRMKDRDFIKRGKPIKVNRRNKKRLFLRELFIDEKDIIIGRLIKNYFNAVQKRWPSAWRNVTKELILNRSTGYIALMRLFPIICEELSFSNNEISVDGFYEMFRKIKIIEDDFNRNNYLPGSSGQSKLFKDLKTFIVR